MFSFFKSKKPSPTQAAGEPIPSATPVTPREDDFIFIERRDPSPKGVKPAPTGESPTASRGGSGLYPFIPGPPASDSSESVTVAWQRSEEKAGNPLHGVPFRLSPDLTLTMDTEITRIQVNDLMCFIARTIYAPGYDFAVERSVLND